MEFNIEEFTFTVILNVVKNLSGQPHIIFAIFVGLISNVMKEKWAYTLPECTVVTVAQENVICASGGPQQTGNRSDYSYGGNWGMIGSDD